MLVYGQIKHTADMIELFSGTNEECREYISKQDLNDYENLNLDEDNGIIAERIVSSGKILVLR